MARAVANTLYLLCNIIVFFAFATSSLATELVVADTIRDLRSIDVGKVTVGASVKVGGYYTFGDGGGGPLRTLQEVTGRDRFIDNGDSVIVPSGGDGRLAWVWNASGEDVIYADWFGLNGKRDELAINRAIQHTPTGKTLLITNAMTTSALKMKSNIKVILTGTIYSRSKGAIIDFSNVNEAEWHGGKLVGFLMNPAQTGFLLRNSKGVKINKVRIENVPNKGVALAANLLFGEATISNRISIDTVSGSNGLHGAGLALSGNGVFDNYIVGGVFKNNRIGLTINGAWLNHLYNVSCFENSLMGLTFDGIVSGRGDGAYFNSASFITTTNNKGRFYGGVYLGNGSSYNTIHKIYSVGNEGAGIKLNAGIGYENKSNQFYDVISGFNRGYSIVLWHAPNTILSGFNSYGNLRGEHSIKHSDGVVYTQRAEKPSKDRNLRMQQ